MLSAFKVSSVIPFLLLSLVRAEPIPAKYKQGSMHGFLLLKSGSKVIAVGDMTQVANGVNVRSRLTFHFRDRSLDDDVTIFRQGKVLQLVSDHHIQKGPSFPKPLDLRINVRNGEVKWRDKDGEIKTEQLTLPDDLANGMMPIVLDNIAPDAPSIKVSYLVPGSKPRIVKLKIEPGGKERFTVAGVANFAHRYNMHIELGGVTGVVAPLVGKQPPDIQAWVLPGEVPSFARMHGAFYDGGPAWTVELTSPTWPSFVEK